MKTKLLRRLRRKSKRKFWIECYNRKYLIKEKYKEEFNKIYTHTLTHNIDTLDKAKEILSNQRRDWIKEVIKDKRENLVNKKLRKL
jgi:hypothetical protein